MWNQVMLSSKSTQQRKKQKKLKFSIREIEEYWEWPSVGRRHQSQSNHRQTTAAVAIEMSDWQSVQVPSSLFESVPVGHCTTVHGAAAVMRSPVLTAAPDRSVCAQTNAARRALIAGHFQHHVHLVIGSVLRHCEYVELSCHQWHSCHRHPMSTPAAAASYQHLQYITISTRHSHSLSNTAKT